MPRREPTNLPDCLAAPRVPNHGPRRRLREDAERRIRSRNSPCTLVLARAESRFCIVAVWLMGLLWVGFARADDPQHRQVLILHSYHPGYVWTSGIHEGLLSAMGAPRLDVDIRTEYLDWKHFSDTTNLQRQLTSLKSKYATLQFDLVITSDNKATDFAVEHRPELFPGTPIVFCGYNGLTPGDMAGQENITGIAEVVDPERTIGMAIGMFPASRHLVMICDGTETGRAVCEEARRGLSRDKPQLSVRFLGEQDSTEDLLKELRRAEPDTLVVIGPYNRDSKGRFLDLWELADLIRSQGIRLPVFHLYEEAMGHGVLGGWLMSGVSQGTAAGRVAREILQGKRTSSFPIDFTPTVTPIVDFAEMGRFGLGPNSIPAGVRVLHPPRSSFERYQVLILGSLAASLAALVAMSIALVLRVQSERSLRRSTERIRRLLHNMPILACAFDDNRRVIVWNRACEKALGYSTEEALRPSVEFERLVREKSWTRIVDVALGREVPPLETVLTGRNGERRTITWSSESRAFPIPGWAGWILGIDVTEQVAAEQRARRKQRMESLGQLAGGVAHDFGNLLTAILGSAELMVMDNPAAPAAAHAEVISGAAHRGRDLVQQLLRFARAEPGELRPVDIHAVLRELDGMLSRTLNKKIRLRMNLHASEHQIRGDAGQLLQVFLNLALNARDAMPEGGTLSFTTSDKEDSIDVTVEDTGTGMSSEVMAKVFDPFFTTKAGEGGTGMGLATAYSIVRSHGGSIDPSSEPGNGTTFHLRFPVAHSCDSATP